MADSWVVSPWSMKLALLRELMAYSFYFPFQYPLVGLIGEIWQELVEKSWDAGMVEREFLRSNVWWGTLCWLVAARFKVGLGFAADGVLFRWTIVFS